MKGAKEVANLLTVKNSKWFAYVGFAVALIALFLGGLGYLSQQVVVLIMGFFGL